MIAGRVGMVPFSIRRESRRVERETGEDSITTIEDSYERTEGGSIRCVNPGCGFVRRDAETMWRHVHGTCRYRDAQRHPPSDAMRRLLGDPSVLSAQPQEDQ